MAWEAPRKPRDTGSQPLYSVRGGFLQRGAKNLSLDIFDVHRDWWCRKTRDGYEKISKKERMMTL